MTEREQKIPGPDHPIDLTQIDRPARIVFDGVEIVSAETYVAVKEAGYDEVAYIPRDNLDDRMVQPSEKRTWCPYKGEARYFHLLTRDGRRVENALWSYEEPFPAVAAIRGMVAAYPAKVDAIYAGEKQRTGEVPNTFEPEERPEPVDRETYEQRLRDS